MNVQQGDYIAMWYYPGGWWFSNVFKVFTPKEILNLTQDELEELITEYELVRLFAPPPSF